MSTKELKATRCSLVVKSDVRSGPPMSYIHDRLFVVSSLD
jgi:hypothetical protein